MPYVQPVGQPYIQVAGKSNLLIGFPDDGYATMHSLGEQLDETKITAELVTHDVPGDSQGGPQGDPIEQQILALRYRGIFNLSKWDPGIRERLITHNLMATPGKFADHEIGALMLRNRSFRIAISPSRSNPIGTTGVDYFFYNFPCCMIASPIEVGQGTKFSVLQFSFRAFRVPQGHPLAPSDHREGLIWDRDAEGIAQEFLPASMIAP
jgi:hypothetical protein